MRSHKIDNSFRNKKNHLRVILYTPPYLELGLTVHTGLNVVKFVSQDKTSFVGNSR